MKKLNIRDLYSAYARDKTVNVVNPVTKSFLIALFELLDFKHDVLELSVNSLLLNFKSQLNIHDKNHVMLPVTDLSHMLEHIALLVTGYPEIFSFDPDTSSKLYVKSNIKQKDENAEISNA